MDDLLRDLPPPATARSASSSGSRPTTRRPDARPGRSASSRCSQRDRAGGAAGEAGISGARDAARRAAESIPFVQRTNDLEYRLASTIRQLSRDKKPAVGSSPAPAAHGRLRRQVGAAPPLLRRARRNLSDSTQPGPDVVHAGGGGYARLPVPGSGQAAGGVPQPRRRHAGAHPGMEVSPQAPTGSAPGGVGRVVLPYGVSIRSDMAYDRLANEVIPLPTDFGPCSRSIPSSSGHRAPARRR